MSAFSKIYHIRHLLVTTLLLPMLCACMFDNNLCEDDIAAPQIATDNQYINLNIVVSLGHENTTRATIPSEGEEGDGREAGLERENHVTGITFMLYEVTNENGGINSSQDAKLAFIKYYFVTRVSSEKEGTSYDTKANEAVYTTGDQPLKGLDLTKKYRAIVVANLDLTTTFIAEKTTVADVCNEVTTYIYKGTGMGDNATDFVMASENEGDLITFDPKPKPDSDDKNKIVYKFEENIRIERLAARVDFWMNNAEYKTEYMKGETAYTYKTPGYEYFVVTKSNTPSPDKFVLTAITPFNLYNNDAEEYLIKRTSTNLHTFQFLADETSGTYVIDPWTYKKTDTSSTYYKNPLSTLVELNKSNNTLADAKGFYQSTQSLYESTTQRVTFDNDGNKDNFIICYPKENTLLPIIAPAPLYYYATGLAIEGDYYESGWEGWEKETAEPNPKVQHLIYYGYLRHQGEGDGTYTIRAADDLSQEETYNTTTPMNFGVVRNNIYRISIDQITEKRDIQLKITVKKWDQFEHDIIYM